MNKVVKRAITPKQKKILDFILYFTEKKGFAPSLEEIAEKIGLKAVSTVHQHIKALEKKGYLRKEDNQPRGILPVQNKNIEIPLLGFIAAGEPIEALSNPEPIKVSTSILGKSGLYYGLKVKGDSMIDENIHDGDTAIIKHQETAENGQKVVALINNNEVTLKKFYREKGNVRLQPANRAYAPIIVDPDNLIIQGIVIDIIKDREKDDKIVIQEIPKKTTNILTKIDNLINRVIEGDCLEVMKYIPSKSINLILCDLPYGTTQNQWDSIIPLDKLWKHYERIIKDNGAIVLNSQGIFTAKLILSNEKLFKYKIVWIKSKSTNFLNAKKQPLRKHEDICVFYNKQTIYHPQMSNGTPYNKGIRKDQLTGSYGVFNPVEVKSDGSRYPNDVIYFKTAESEGKVLHPTQKPVELGRYLINTYTSENDIVLDNACGSGSYLVAAVRTNRRFIGIELNKDPILHKKYKLDYIKICNERIQQAQINNSSGKLN